MSTLAVFPAEVGIAAAVVAGVLVSVAFGLWFARRFGVFR